MRSTLLCVMVILSASINANTSEMKTAGTPNLVGYWKLQGDCIDYSGAGNNGVNHGADLSNTDGAIFDGKNAFISVPNSKSLRFDKGDFTISAWVKCKPGAGYTGDIISKYDPDTRRGINLCISGSSPGYSSVSDIRNVQFGIDNAVESEWIDCGRPSPTNTLISTLIAYRGSLYTGIADATDPKLACHVFRYDGGKRWVDCGRVGNDLKTTSIYSIIVHKGELYVGTGVWDWEKAWSADAGPTHVYRYEGGTKWHDYGKFGTGYRVLSLASLNGDLYATDDQGFCYRYDGDYNWTESGKIQDSKIYSTMVYQDRLYGGGNVTAYRYGNDGIWDTVGKFDVSTVNQIHTMTVYSGELYAGTWPEGKILRYDGLNSWADCGNVGVNTDQYKINEINDLTVYNGKMYAGVIPKGEVWRYDGGVKSTLIKRLVENPNYIATSLPSWNRVPCLTTFQGRLYAGTSTCQAQPDPDPKLDVGKVFSWEAGKNVSYDDDLGTDWRHIVAVREKNYLKLYIDGRLVSKSTKFNPQDFDLANDKPLLIGFGPLSYFNGTMRELKIYNRALKPAEINSLQKTVAPMKITEKEKTEWLRWAIPLPKRVSITKALKLPIADVRLRATGNAGDVINHAVSLLDELLHTEKRSSKGRFEILIGICDPDGVIDGIEVPEAIELENLPNKEQAYCISSAIENKIIVTALNERGVFYGVQTLKSLLEGRLSGDKVTIPMATIVDWPDIGQRGRWGGTFNGLMINDIDADIEWMSSLKLNLIEACIPYTLVPGGKNVADINSNALERARLNALRYVPIIPHPDLLGMFGNAYKVMPQIKGKGSAAESEGRIAPCASSQDYIRFLTDWMMTLAENAGVTDICGWLTEHPVYCECEDCKKIGNQYVAEALAYIKAWRITKKTHPELGLRI
ncbi:MAG: LamG domain-containing protein [Armatimonadota bacterium]